MCAKKCPKECIDLAAEGRTRRDTRSGNIILATGYDIYDATKIERYGYGVLPNVLTALEFERMTNASGPTGGKIVTKTLKHNKRKKVDEWVLDPGGTPSEKVAIIHCVGSRDAQHNAYCSRVCCMYSLKFAHLVTEKLPDATCYEYYIDMRAFGKGYEEFAERIAAEGTFVVRGRTARIVEEDGQMVIKGEDILSEKMIDTPVDMVILAVGLVPAEGTERLAEMLGIARDTDGWFGELDYNSDPDRHRTGRGVRGRSLPGSQGHPGHGRPGLGRRGRGAQEHQHRPRIGQPGRAFAERHRSAGAQPRQGLRRVSMAIRVNPKLIDDLEVFGAEDVSKCYHCGNCSAVCPFSKEPHIIPAPVHALPADGPGEEPGEQP